MKLNKNLSLGRAALDTPLREPFGNARDTSVMKPFKRLTYIINAIRQAPPKIK